MLILLATSSYRQARLQLLETRNRLHIYSRACCASCGPRYQPLSRAPFTLRGIRLIHPPSFELACCRSDLFKASSTSRLTRKEQENLRNRYLRWHGHWRQQWNAANVVRVIPFLSGHDRPQNSGVLVGQGDHRSLPTNALPQFMRPQEYGVVVLACEDNGLGPLNQKGAQVDAPLLVILPKLVLPPLECCLGVKPSQAANCAPFLNCLKSPTVATSADAVIEPTPISSAARWTCSSSFW